MAAQVTSVAVSTSFSTSTLLTPFTRTATSAIVIPSQYTTDSTRLGPLGDTVVQSGIVVQTQVTSTLETVISHIRTLPTTIPVQTIYSLSTMSTSTPSTTIVSTTTAVQPPTRPSPPATSSTTSSGVEVVVVTAYTTITPSSTSSLSTSSSTSPSSSVRGASAGADRNAGNTSSSSSTGGLSTGAIAGIAVGGLAAILLVALAIVLCIKRNRRDSRRDSSLYAHAPSHEKLPEDPSGGTFDVLPRNAQPASSGGGGYNYAGLGSAGAVLTGAAAGAARRESQQRPAARLTNEQRQSATRELAKASRPGPPPVSQLQYARPPSQQPNTMASGSGMGYSTTPIAAQWASHNTLAQEPQQQQQRPMPSHIARVQAHEMGQQQAQPHQQPLASTSAAGVAGGAAAAGDLSRSSTMKSIAPELLGKGAGYASPMPPMGPDGKILDQKTFRERQSLIAQGFNPAIDLTAEQKIRRDSQLAALQDQAQRRTSAAIANQKQGGPGIQSNSQAAPAPVSPPPAVVSPTRRASGQQGPSQPRQQPQPQYPAYQPQPAAQQQQQQSRLSDVIPGPPPSSNTASPSSPPPNQGLPPYSQQQRAFYQIYQPLSAASQPPVRASLISPPNMRGTGNRDLPSPPVQSQYPSPPSSDFSPSRTQSYQMPPGAAMPSPYQQNSYNDSYRPRQQTFADDVYGGLTSGLSDRDIARLSKGGPSAPPRR